MKKKNKKEREKENKFQDLEEVLDVVAAAVAVTITPEDQYNRKEAFSRSSLSLLSIIIQPPPAAQLHSTSTHNFHISIYTTSSYSSISPSFYNNNNNVYLFILKKIKLASRVSK